MRTNPSIWFEIPSVDWIKAPRGAGRRILVKLVRFLPILGILALGLGILTAACGDDDDDDEVQDVAEDVQEEAEEAADEAEDAAEDAAGGENNVAIVDNAFDPDTITVSVGDTVEWTNTGDNPHTVTSDEEGVWDSGTLENGGTFSFTFEEAGTVTYHCNIHPSMQAEVVVE
jgi:plastocyanin